jgi:hypothetical protein
MKALILALLLIPALADAQTLTHYWNFNTPETQLTPTLSTGGASLTVSPGELTEVTSGTGQDFAGTNSRNEDPAGAHLRVNNPIGAVLTFHIPTSGFENPIFRYETRRSGSGANTQFVSYSLNGTDFTPMQTILPPDGVPAVIILDFSTIAAADDNADFRIRITIAQEGTESGGTAGNNRFDNATLDATALAGTNLPPVLNEPIGFTQVIVGGPNLSIDPKLIFSDPDEDDLTFEFTSSNPDAIHCVFYLMVGIDHICNVITNHQGEATFTLTADDGVNEPVSTTFRVLAYPAAHELTPSAPFTFSEWDENEPAGSFPSNMMFLQSEVNDPTLVDALLFAYNIPLEDASDPADAAFPYKAIARTRINGLGAEGISFINTGRGRDLGGALVAVNLSDVTSGTLSFTAATLTANFRTYNLRLRYRVGTTSDWSDVMNGAEAVEYQRNAIEFLPQTISDIAIPSDALGQPYVQFLWQYYHTGVQLEGGGARDRIRLDDITITDLTDTSIEQDLRVGSIELNQNYPNPFNPSTAIRFQLPASGITHLAVYDMLGRRVAVLVDGSMAAGHHTATFDASSLTSGMYLYRLTSGGQTLAKQMLLIK